MSALPDALELPSSMVVRDMLSAMLGRDVKLVPSGPWTPTLRDPGAVAAYVGDDGELRALISCDLELSVALSASIALIPAKMAAECVKDGRLTESMVENLYEVLNILGASFNRPDGPHVRLDGLHVPGELPPAEMLARPRVLGSRENVKIEVAGYGSGRLSLELI